MTVGGIVRLVGGRSRKGWDFLYILLTRFEIMRCFRNDCVQLHRIDRALSSQTDTNRKEMNALGRGEARREGKGEARKKGRRRKEKRNPEMMQKEKRRIRTDLSVYKEGLMRDEQGRHERGRQDLKIACTGIRK